MYLKQNISNYKYLQKIRRKFTRNIHLNKKRYLNIMTLRKQQEKIPHKKKQPIHLILHMKAHFLKDEHNTLYLQNASETTVRKSRRKIQEKEMTEQIDEYNLKTKHILLKELEESNQAVKSDRVEAIYKLMRKNYECLKRKAGLIETKIKDTDPLKVEEAYKILHPSSPYKLNDIIHPSFNSKRRVNLLKKNNLKVSKNIHYSIGTPNDIKKYKLNNSIKTERQLCTLPAKRQNRFSCHRSLLQMSTRMQSHPDNNTSLINNKNDSVAISYGSFLSRSNYQTIKTNKYAPHHTH